MTRLISKKQAIKLRTERANAFIGLSLVYSLKQQKRLTKDEFLRLESVARKGWQYQTKKIKSLVK
ncbi:MAG: hypothetical protein J6U02_03930 [Elusimicrobia bacterium]|nr:hypothetical protein [Elusimicrobiota bacterium]